ncbi:MAG TPA: inorganic diphosphatase [Anaerolineae bacterium]
MSEEIVDARTFLGRVVDVKVDRPLGSVHPTGGFIYLVNYGFVPGVLAPDGDNLDAYVLGVFEPVENFTGRCIAIINRINDNEDKLVVAPQGKSYSDDQIRALTEFQERFFKSIVVRRGRGY